MSAKVTIIEMPPISAPMAFVVTPIPIVSPWTVAFQQSAFQSNAFQMSPVLVASATYLAKVTVVEITP